MRNDALETLRECESKLRTLVGSAAKAGHYDQVTWITQRLRTLSQWIEDASDWKSEAPSEPDAPNVSKPSSASEAKKERRQAPKKGSSYPRFFRDRDHLLKAGWSKKRKAEYTHRAPQDVVNGVVSTVASEGRRASVVPPDKLLVARDSNGQKIPDYQVYLALAWLRKQGLVRRRGRTGYVVPDPDELVKRVRTLWAALPERTE